MGKLKLPHSVATTTSEFLPIIEGGGKTETVTFCSNSTSEFLPIIEGGGKTKTATFCSNNIRSPDIYGEQYFSLLLN
jgi:hypothetical protein